jgi:hypothetical protein
MRYIKSNKNIFLYEIYCIFLAPLYYNLINSIKCYYNSIRIFSKKSFFIPHFDTQRAYVSFWYRAVIYNVNKYKFIGRTNFLGGPNYPISFFWHYNKYIVNLYTNYGHKFLLICSFILLFSNLIFFKLYVVEENFNIFHILLFLIYFFSRDFSEQIFRYQNYNLLAWTVVPIIFLFFIKKNYLFFYFFFYLASFSSFTVFFIINYTFSILFIYYQEILLLFLLQVPILFYIYKIIDLKTKNFFKDFLYASVVSNYKIFNKKMLPNSKENLFRDKNELIYFLSKIQFFFIFFDLSNLFFLIFLILFSLYLINFYIIKLMDLHHIKMGILLAIFPIFFGTHNINIFQIWSFFFSINYLVFHHQYIYPKNVKKVYKLVLTMIRKCKINTSIFLFYHRPKFMDKIMDGQLYFASILNYLSTKNKILIAPDAFTYYHNTFKDNFSNKKKITTLHIYLKKNNFRYILFLTDNNKYKKLSIKNSSFKKIHSINWDNFFLKNKELREIRDNNLKQIWTLYKVI